MPKSDLERIDRLKDEDIDYSDIPPLSDEQLAAMQPLRQVFPALAKQQTRVTISLDADIIKWFEQQMPDTASEKYQALVNTALREYIMRQRVAITQNLRQTRAGESQSAQ